MEIIEKYIKVLHNLLIKKLLERIFTVLVASGKREEKAPYKHFTLRWINVLTSASKGMYIV